MRGEMSRKTPKFRDKPRRRKKMSRKTPQNRDKNTSAQRIPNKNLYIFIITQFQIYRKVKLLFFPTKIRPAAKKNVPPSTTISGQNTPGQQNILVLSAEPGQTSPRRENVPASTTIPGENTPGQQNILISSAEPGQTSPRRKNVPPSTTILGQNPPGDVRPFFWTVKHLFFRLGHKAGGASL